MSASRALRTILGSAGLNAAMILLALLGRGLVTSGVRIAWSDTLPPSLEKLTPRQRDALEKIRLFMQPIAEDRVFYHYGYESTCQNLIQTGRMTPEVHRNYADIPVSGAAVAGHGIYMAGNPTSSLSYFRGGANEIVIPRGTPQLDLSRPEVVQMLAQMGISERDVHELPVEGVIRYNSQEDWFVLKGAPEVRFRSLSFSALDRRDWAKLAATLESQPSSTVYRELLKSFLDAPPVEREARMIELVSSQPRAWKTLLQLPAADVVRVSHWVLGNLEPGALLKASAFSKVLSPDDLLPLKQLAATISAELVRMSAQGSWREADIKFLVGSSAFPLVSEESLIRALSSMDAKEREKVLTLLEQAFKGYQGRAWGAPFAAPYGLKESARLLVMLEALEDETSAGGGFERAVSSAQRFIFECDARALPGYFGVSQCLHLPRHAQVHGANLLHGAESGTPVASMMQASGLEPMA